MDLKYVKHPSYGKITLGKPTASSGGISLFGSKVKHPSFVSLEISRASLAEDGFSEFIGGGDSLIKINMSEAQWAHMVSSFGSGSGTPVTLYWTREDGLIESPPDPIPVIDLARASAAETKADLVKRLRNLERDVKNISEGSGPVRKKDLAQVAMDFNVLASWLDSNLDYLENQVKDRMEKEVAKANIEIEAIISNAVARLGERALAAGEKIELPSLERGEHCE